MNATPAASCSSHSCPAIVNTPHSAWALPPVRASFETVLAGSKQPPPAGLVRQPDMHPARASRTPPAQPTSGKSIPLCRDFTLPQLHLLAFDPAASPNGCSLNTSPGHLTDKPSLGLEHSSASLSHARVNSSSSEDEDMPMTDLSMDGSSGEAFHSVAQVS